MDPRGFWQPSYLRQSASTLALCAVAFGRLHTVKYIWHGGMGIKSDKGHLA